MKTQVFKWLLAIAMILGVSTTLYAEKELTTDPTGYATKYHNTGIYAGWNTTLGLQAELTNTSTGALKLKVAKFTGNGTSTKAYWGNKSYDYQIERDNGNLITSGSINPYGGHVIEIPIDTYSWVSGKRFKVIITNASGISTGYLTVTVSDKVEEAYITHTYLETSTNEVKSGDCITASLKWKKSDGSTGYFDSYTDEGFSKVYVKSGNTAYIKSQTYYSSTWNQVCAEEGLTSDHTVLVYTEVDPKTGISIGSKSITAKGIPATQTGLSCSTSKTTLDDGESTTIDCDATMSDGTTKNTTFILSGYSSYFIKSGNTLTANYSGVSDQVVTITGEDSENKLFSDTLTLTIQGTPLPDPVKDEVVVTWSEDGMSFSAVQTWTEGKADTDITFSDLTVIYDSSKLSYDDNGNFTDNYSGYGPDLDTVTISYNGIIISTKEVVITGIPLSNIKNIRTDAGFWETPLNILKGSPNQVFELIDDEGTVLGEYTSDIQGLIVIADLTLFDNYSSVTLRYKDDTSILFSGWQLAADDEFYRARIDSDLNTILASVDPYRTEDDQSSFLHTLFGIPEAKGAGVVLALPVFGLELTEALVIWGSVSASVVAFYDDLKKLTDHLPDYILLDSSFYKGISEKATILVQDKILAANFLANETISPSSKETLEDFVDMAYEESCIAIMEELGDTSMLAQLSCAALSARSGDMFDPLKVTDSSWSNVGSSLNKTPDIPSKETVEKVKDSMEDQVRVKMDNYADDIDSILGDIPRYKLDYIKSRTAFYADLLEDNVKFTDFKNKLGIDETSPYFDDFITLAARDNKDMKDIDSSWTLVAQETMLFKNYNTSIGRDASKTGILNQGEETLHISTDTFGTGGMKHTELGTTLRVAKRNEDGSLMKNENGDTLYEQDIIANDVMTAYKQSLEDMSRPVDTTIFGITSVKNTPVTFQSLYNIGGKMIPATIRYNPKTTTMSVMDANGKLRSFDEDCSLDDFQNMMNSPATTIPTGGKEVLYKDNVLYKKTESHRYLQGAYVSKGNSAWQGVLDGWMHNSGIGSNIIYKGESMSVSAFIAAVYSTYEVDVNNTAFAFADTDGDGVNNITEIINQTPYYVATETLKSSTVVASSSYDQMIIWDTEEVGNTRVTIAAGAFESDTTVTINKVSSSIETDDGSTLLSIADYGPDGTQFPEGKEATVEMLYTGDNPDNAVIAKMDKVTKTLAYLDTTAKSSGYVSATTDSFSVFALLELPPSTPSEETNTTEENPVEEETEEVVDEESNNSSESDTVIEEEEEVVTEEEIDSESESDT
ncbi:MAG: hypothetical protein U9Q15_00890, partial [Patescibacteria group bacterium]|nr:hypothetical protein [Patescibacteria group bacterium]